MLLQCSKTKRQSGKNNRIESRKTKNTSHKVSLVIHQSGLIDNGILLMGSLDPGQKARHVTVYSDRGGIKCLA